MIDTITGVPITDELLQNYFKSLVNCFFKILPIRENEEDTLWTYIESLQIELLGCKELICVLKDDSGFLTLIAILQYLLDNPECPVKTVKREVFKAINICKRLQTQYGDKAV